MKRVIVSIILLAIFTLPMAASAAQNHSIPNGYSLYSITYRSMSDDDGICKEGADKWRDLGTSMTHSTSSSNHCYVNYYLENWYGLYEKGATSRFIIRINMDSIEKDYPRSTWNAAISVAVHEFGHAQYLGDHDTEGEGVYKTTSIMSYDRNRATMTAPGSHDEDDLWDLRNP